VSYCKYNQTATTLATEMNWRKNQTQN